MSPRSFDVYAPLQDFQWQGNDFELASDLRIRWLAETPDLAGLDASLAKDERERVSNASHWLTFQWTEDVVPSPAEVVNLVLLSLWIVKPIRLQVAFLFEIGQEATANQNRRHRLLDRFAWVPGTIDPDFEDSDLKSASSFYAPLHSLCRARGRLNNALILTIAGCWSHGWQSALICYAAAAEAVLTYATDPGITRRLATSYACLVETQKPERDVAYKEFSAVYAGRSDIMHGRSHNIPTPERLPTLVRFQDTLRKLWQAVLSSKQLMAVLEGNDAQREAHFGALEGEYTPPP